MNMDKDKRGNITNHNEMHDCIVFMGDSNGGIFPLPGSNVTIHQEIISRSKPKQQVNGACESMEQRTERKRQAMKDMCKRLEQLDASFLGYTDRRERVSITLLCSLLQRFLGMHTIPPKQEYLVIQEQIWTILIDHRVRCVKPSNDLYFPQTFLNIIGYLREKGLISGKVTELLHQLYPGADDGLVKNIERSELNAFPEGTHEMFDFYINKMSHGEI